MSKDMGLSGNWLDAMAGSLITKGQIELRIISSDRKLKLKPYQLNNYGINQLILPFWSKPIKNGFPDSRYINSIIKFIKEFNPDILHIWGTENYWGLFPARKITQIPTLITVQGFKYLTSEKFHGNLTFREKISCIGFKEIFQRSSIFDVSKKYRNWGIYEREIIGSEHNFSYHSDWQRTVIQSINPKAKVFPCGLVLRPPFYQNNAKWDYTKLHDPVVFCSFASANPLKGLHIAIRAIHLLNNEFPKLKLRIAGLKPREGFIVNGYRSWIKREIKRYKLEKKIFWLGALNALELIDELKKTNIFLMPSFLESYSMTVAEAMMVGTPVVSSFVGGPATLLKDEETCMFFPAGDVIACADKLRRLLTDTTLSRKISSEANKVALERHNPDEIIRNQLDIYKSIKN